MPISQDVRPIDSSRADGTAETRPGPVRARLLQALALGRPLWMFGAVYLVISALLRLVLWVQFGRPEGVSAVEMPKLLAIGALNDVVQVLYLLLPATFLLCFTPRRWLGSRLVRAALFVLGTGWIFGVLYISAVEYFFFEEFDARFNLVAVDYLMYPHEVLINIRDSYPVMQVWLLAGVASLALMTWVWSRLRRSAASVPVRWRGRFTMFAVHVVLIALVAAKIPAQTFVTFDNRLATEIASNGIGSFWEALRTQEINYQDYYRTGDPAALRSLLKEHLETPGARFVESDDGRFDRRFEPRPGAFQLCRDPSKRPNVVVVTEESLGAEFIGAYGASPSFTPEFDALARRGLLFTHAYATGTRTVRGLEAINASFPPIPSVSIVKRPGYDHVMTWGGVLKKRGYHTSFLYGGFGYFDNMNAFFGSNGHATSDRSEIENPRFANIWGVSDQDLFQHALDYYDDLGKRDVPFFSVIMTTSNHKPFTFPPGIPGVPEEGGGRQAGVRYADYALGEFLRLAESHDWFEDTLFLVVGDHGARVYGAADVPLYSYEIPILLLAPGRLEPREVSAPISQLDIAPTVLGMLGEPYEAPFFGQDVLADGAPGEDRALLFNHNHDVALLRGNEMIVFGLRQSVDAYSYDRSQRTFTPIPPDPDLVELTTAYYQTADELFHSGLYR